jgi:hypothetical protein
VSAPAKVTPALLSKPTSTFEQRLAKLAGDAHGVLGAGVSS